MDVHQWENEAVKTGFGRIASYERHVDLVDKEFGRFFVALNKTERGRNAVIIITADHGESLGEQGLFYHGFMAPATLRVPLIVRLPGQSRKQVAATVGLLDLAPTVLGMAGLRWPNLPGRDLRSLVAPDPSDRPVFHETLLRTSRMEMGVTGVTTYPWQLIYDYRYNILTLTNLENDPKGENNLAGQDLPAESALLRSLLDFYQRRCPS